MSGKLFNSTGLDANGRQSVLSDNITHVRYYDSSLESWDHAAVSASWFTEVYSPNDMFDEASVNTSRWSLNGPPTRTLGHVGGSLVVGVEKDDGNVYLSSEGKWRLSGDFDVRLYIDWSSYYNEYRSLTRSFLKIGYDDSNAVRVSFVFDGVSGYHFSSEKTVARDIRYFDWRGNGPTNPVAGITAAAAQTFLKVTRTSGVVRTYVSDGVTDTQVGSDVTDTVFAGDVYVELGAESKEYNTYRLNYTKFYVVSGIATPAAEFFSSNRGRRQDFPPRIVAVVDEFSLSLIDEDTSTLWMRFAFGDPNLLPDSNVRVSMCEGVLYCATSGGLVAFDFVQDKIFKYTTSEIQVADEAIALRNAGVTFRTYMSASGTIPSSNVRDVACRAVGSEVYIAFTHSDGVSVKRALAEGVSSSSDGPAPGSVVSISDKGALFWAGFDLANNTGEISYYSNVTSLAVTGTSSFSRSGYYGTATPLPILGEIITSFDVRTVDGFDQLVVGSTEGITFITQNPATSTTYGVDSPVGNPFTDPTFDKHLGIHWVPFYDGLIGKANILRSTAWVTADTYSLLLRFDNLPVPSHFVAGTQCGVYQEVDLTGVERIYYDINLVGGGASVWEFQVTVDGEVVKSYANGDGSFVKLTDSAPVLEYEGVRRVEFRLHIPVETSSGAEFTNRYVYVANVQTEIGNPTQRVLPQGNAAIKEVLLQYDTQGHKVYFASAEGFGAIDLDDRSLDYFTKMADVVPDPTTENLSADFARITDEG